MMKRFGNAMMALAVASSMMLASAPEAQAWRGRNVGVGVAAGIIGLGILGAAAAARDRDYDGPRYRSRYDDDRCYRGPRECHWAGRRCFENEFGDTVCRGGRYLCERPVICD
jgi:hypothetical protein